MKAVLQRVLEASVEVEEKTVGQIKKGWLILLGVSKSDTEKEAQVLAEKTIHLRAFPDSEDKLNLSILDIKGEILVVSQFTIYGDLRKGRRPSFTDAAPAEIANELYQKYVQILKDSGLTVGTGIFQAMMKVRLINDGPVTLIMDSKDLIKE